MIEARHITKRYGDRVILDGADISVGGGQAVVLTGDNGSGKTTLIQLLTGSFGLRVLEWALARAPTPGIPHVTDAHPLVRPSSAPVQ